MLYAAGIFYFRRRRAWLGYYLFAALGLVLIVVFGAQALGLAGWFEYITTWTTVKAANLIGISSQFLGRSDFMVADKNGWVALQTTIECSALIESSVLTGLILFYPAFTKRRKLMILVVGLPITWIANIVRLLIITWMVSFYGRAAVFIGHAIVGRMFFLIVMIALFWYVLTMPTIREVARNVESEGARP
jgi:exosortase family protein XrtG